MIVHLTNSSLIFVCGENKKHPERVLTGSADTTKTTCMKCRSIMKAVSKVGK